MKKLQLGLLLTGLSVVVIVVAVYWLYLLYTSAGGTNSMGQMMGQMMGGGQPITGIGYMYWVPLLFFIPLVAGILLVGYFSLYPEIRSQPPSVSAVTAASSQTASFDSVMKTMKPEEKRILELLHSHGGVYLQKNLRTESGLSRLKVHRIIARLAERSIVTVKEQGNTNEVSLAEWLRN